jgi:cytochrome c-type biogenesis protein CcmF
LRGTENYDLGCPSNKREHALNKDYYRIIVAVGSQMDYDVVLLVGAAVFVLVDIILLATSKSGDKRKNARGFVLSIFALGLIISAYVFLLQAFTNNNFQIVNVYSYSSSGASLLSKVYASWAGAGGSMLFLTVLLSIVYFALRLLAFRNPDKFKSSTCQVFGFVLLVFIIVCLLRNPFESYTGIPTEGRGLNPQLQSFWMAIHPPIVFSAYAFVVLAYALTLASVKTGKELDTSKLFKTSTYAAWLLLTLGIALGGVWAYEVLGWGGYWAWDPVETASLLPWLFLTAYFFVKAIAKSKLSLTREFMIMITFASLVFLSALTRGGFTQSVHSYAVSAVGPIMLGFALAMIAYFFYLKKNRRLPLFKLSVNKSSLTSRSFFLGFWALIFISAVCLIGLAFTNFAYSYWTFPFVLIFVIAAIGVSLDEKTHYARLLLIVLVAVGVGVAVTLIGFPNVNSLTTFTVPLLAVAFSTIFYKILKSIKRKSLPLFGQGFLSIAIIVLLLGIFLSAGAKTTVTIDNVKTDTQVEAMQLNLQLSDLRISNSSAKVHNEQVGAVIPECSTIKADVTVQQSEKVYDGTLVASFYPNYGLVIKPLIITTETGDIYLHLEYSDSLYNALVEVYSGNSNAPSEVSITVQYSPMIYLVWTGVGLMLISMSVQFAAELSPQKQRKSTKEFS